ncbi:MAG: GNAT family N-acetyltransferase [Pseudomonadota bacterium]
MDIQALTYDELDLDQVHAVRRLAWLDKYPVFAEHIAVWEDAFERRATHFIMTDLEQLVGVARFNYADAPSLRSQFKHAPDMVRFVGSLRSPVGVISRLSVHPNARGRGVAKQLDEARIAFAKAQNCSAIVCEVKTGAHREAALARLGFTPVENAKPYPAYPFPHVDKAPIRLCQPLFMQLDQTASK